MGVPKSLRDRVALIADSDHVDVVVHQAVRPHRHAEPFGEKPEEAQVGPAIVVGVKDELAVDPPQMVVPLAKLQRKY